MIFWRTALLSHEITLRVVEVLSEQENRLSELCTLLKKAARHSDHSGASGSSGKPPERPEQNLPKTWCLVPTSSNFCCATGDLEWYYNPGQITMSDGYFIITMHSANTIQPNYSHSTTLCCCQPQLTYCSGNLQSWSPGTNSAFRVGTLKCWLPSLGSVVDNGNLSRHHNHFGNLALHLQFVQCRDLS